MNRNIFLLTLCIAMVVMMTWEYLQAGPPQPRSSGLRIGNSASGKPGDNAGIGQQTPVIDDTLVPPKIEPPIQGPVAHDPLSLFVPTLLPGQLLYAFNDLAPTPLLSYIVTRASSATNPSQQIKVNTLTYPVKNLDVMQNGVSFDPQFSPDGNHVLLKIGEPRISVGSYHIYVWEPKTNLLKLVTSRDIAFRLVSWSPDGNYLSYIVGGDAEGNRGGPFGHQLEPLRLLLCDWRTGKERLITRNDTVRFNTAWASPHTLLYSILPLIQSGHNSQGKVNRNRAASKTTQRPNIYSASVETGKTTLLIRDGERPQPSPNGQWIAFFGSENPDKPLPLNNDWWYRPGSSALLIARSDGTQRTALTVDSGPYPFLMWEPDNQHLLAIKQVQSSPEAKSEIKEWDIKTRHWRLVGTLQAKDVKRLPRMASDPQIRPLSLSKDGNFLFVLIQEVTGETGESLDEVFSLQTVNLRTGVTSTIARINDWGGLDWHNGVIVPANPK